MNKSFDTQRKMYRWVAWEEKLKAQKIWVTIHLKVFHLFVEIERGAVDS